MPKYVFIYALYEPETGEVRYIGKATDPQKRLYDHLKDSQGDCYRIRWVKSLKRRGLKPLMRIWDIVPEQDWQFWERWYIKNLRHSGARLVNGTDGGEGLSGRQHSAETKSKMRLSAIARGYTPALIERLRILNRGKHISPEHKRAISEANTGNKRLLGYRPSQEHRAKLSAALLGNTRTRGHKHSESARENMRAGQLAAWKRRKELSCPTI